MPPAYPNVRSPAPWRGRCRAWLLLVVAALQPFYKPLPSATFARNLLAVGADAGGGPQVNVYDADSGTALFAFFAYDPSFTGGVRVALGDVNSDGNRQDRQQGAREKDPAPQRREKRDRHRTVKSSSALRPSVTVAGLGSDAVPSFHATTE